MHSEPNILEPALFAVTEVPSPRPTDLRLVFGHGWGQSAAALLPLAEALKPFVSSSLIDFPGFGKSPLPPDHWGTAEYADAVSNWLEQLRPQGRYIWVGHSFGGRVGLQLAARHPETVTGLVLIAAAGLQRKRTLVQRARISVRRTLFRMAKQILGEGPQLNRLRQKMGSADYRSAGALRPIFNRVVQEDLTSVAVQVHCPTVLIYGKEDTETPPEMGERLNRLIKGSELTVLDGFGHLSILNEGRHQLAVRIRRFLEARAR